MKKIRLTVLSLIWFLVFSFAGCTGGQSKSQGETDVSFFSDGREDPFIANEDMIDKPFLILDVDSTLEQMILRDTQSGRQYLFNYRLETFFYDKYGQGSSITQFMPGRVAEIKEIDKHGNVKAMALSDKVWEYEKIENYTIDRDRGVFTIGQTNYRLSGITAVFSDKIESTLDDIGAEDTLRIVGEDRDIWSITVTSGHGTLTVINTSVFDGSLICIGNFYTLINGQMSLELPEGTYNVTVANNGYGGTIEVTVPKNSGATVDLSVIEKQPLKSCKLTFKLDVEGAKMTLDGDEIKKDEVLDVAYGRHVLSLKAEGYESWTKYIYVNSPTATIVLEMDEEGTGSGSSSGGSSSDKDKEDENTPVSKTESQKEREEEQQKVEMEYLTTIRDMISSLTGL